MNKEIKIIDLLNMIAEGKEVPKKIKYVKYNYEAYTYDNDIKDYISDRGNYGLFATATLTYILNDTVEIIEEDNNEIEKLDIEQDGQTLNNFYLTNENGTKCYLTKHSKMIAEKINEIIDKINNL